MRKTRATALNVLFLYLLIILCLYLLTGCGGRQMVAPSATPAASAGGYYAPTPAYLPYDGAIGQPEDFNTEEYSEFAPGATVGGALELARSTDYRSDPYRSEFVEILERKAD
ncbi:MAG: hypothetical protein LBK98_05450 [Peptococcaceae bacterium]|jgi:hypothetical protein|nr:hypothetical protein [Peptococcaceae bacterium]